MVKKVQTSTAPAADSPDARILLMSPSQARALHRLVSNYNVMVEAHGSPTGKREADLEASLLRLACAE